MYTAIIVMAEEMLVLKNTELFSIVSKKGQEVTSVCSSSMNCPPSDTGIMSAVDTEIWP